MLKENNIIFEHDKTFAELKNYYSEKTLRFDFILYNPDGSINRFIEFDGRQHFYGPDTNFWSRTVDTLESIQKRDEVKNKFCLENNYKLVRIPFYHLPYLKIEDLMGDTYLIKE